MIFSQLMSAASWIKFVLYSSLVIGLYRSTLLHIVFEWADAEFNYCYFLPIAILYVLWRKKAALEGIQSKPTWMGLLLLAAGLSLFGLGTLSGGYASLYASLWLTCVSLAYMHLGWKKLKEVSFAILLALFIFPLPGLLNNEVSSGLGLISSRFSITVMRLFGLGNYGEEYASELGFAGLQIPGAYEGLSFVPFLLLGMIVACFAVSSFWKRLIVVLSIVPVSVVATALRIPLTSFMSQRLSDSTTMLFYGFSNWIALFFSLIVLLAEIWLLKRIEAGMPTRNRASVRHKIDPISVIPDAENRRKFLPARKGFRESLGQPVFVIAVILLGGMLLFSSIPGQIRRIMPF
ncbi:MAG: archaeosortase/exosortase family protein [Pseudomonadota bacterium]